MRVVLSIADANAVRVLTVPWTSHAYMNFVHEDCLSVHRRQGNEQNSLLRFDLDRIPVGRTITRAMLTLSRDSALWPAGDNGSATRVFRLTKPCVQWQVTWVRASGYRLSNAVLWDRQGGDFVGVSGRADGSDPYASGALNLGDESPGTFPLALDVTALVSEWHTGASPNYGLLLTGEEGNGLHFRADRGDDPSLFPTLAVDFQ
jgi:hypothetical protein